MDPQESINTIRIARFRMPFWGTFGPLLDPFKSINPLTDARFRRPVWDISDRFWIHFGAIAYRVYRFRELRTELQCLLCQCLRRRGAACSERAAEPPAPGGTRSHRQWLRSHRQWLRRSQPNVSDDFSPTFIIFPLTSSHVAAARQGRAAARACNGKEGTQVTQSNAK